MNYETAKTLIQNIHSEMNKIPNQVWNLLPGTDREEYELSRTRVYEAFLCNGMVKLHIAVNFGGYTTAAHKNKICVSPVLPHYMDMYLTVVQEDIWMRWDRTPEALAKDIVKRALPNAIEVFEEYNLRLEELNAYKARVSETIQTVLAGTMITPPTQGTAIDIPYGNTAEGCMLSKLEVTDGVRFNGLLVTPEIANEIIKLILKPEALA